jgi:ABC-type bacteriocin/lantibiotic exporter with double-glycine peptidase domain
MAGADLPLLRGSIARNLAYRKSDASQEELDEIARLCGVDTVLARLPAGIATRVREGGQGLSAGERGRLLLARALVGAPRVLLLDEIENSLDAEARVILGRVLADFPGTILVATHDPEIIACCDAVWHLEDGRLLRVSEDQEKENGDVTEREVRSQ